MKNSIGEGLTKGVLLLLAGNCLLLVSCSTPPEGDSSDGKRWFAMQHCNGCHGERGSGGKAPQIQETDLTYRKLLSKVRKSKSAIMPSYSAEQLSDKNVADIFSYIQ